MLSLTCRNETLKYSWTIIEYAFEMLVNIIFSGVDDNIMLRLCCKG